MEQLSTRRTTRVSTQHIPVSTPDLLDEEYDDVWPPRLPTSTRRYRSDATTNPGSFQSDVQPAGQGEQPITRIPGKNAVPPRRTATQTMQDPVLRRASADRSSPGRSRPDRANPDPDTEDFSGGHRHSEPLRLPNANVDAQQLPWTGYVGLALIVMLMGWLVLSLLTSWGAVALNDLRYGRPRTFQIDAVVGHNDTLSTPSHFIALNLNRRVQVIEFPGGDSTKARVYLGPVLVGAGQDLSPVTLTFKDVNGDGKPDLIIHVQDSNFVFINENGQFRPPHLGEISNT